MRKIAKKAFSLLAVLGLSFAIGAPTFQFFSASAGMEQTTTFESAYDNGALKSGEWEANYQTDGENNLLAGAIVEADAGKKPGLRITDGYEGAGLVTQAETDGAKSVRIEADVEYLQVQSGGWVAFLLGTHDAPTIMNWSKINSGDYVLLSNINNVWYLNTQTKDKDGNFKNYGLVNAAGESIQNDGDGSHFYRLDLPNKDTLENVTLSLQLNDQGNLSFTIREIGQAQSAERILAKTASTPYEAYEDGRLGFCVMQSSFGGVNGKLNDFRTYTDGEERTKFRFNEENVSADYLLDPSTKPNSLSFDAEGKLKLKATASDRAYAINKSYVRQDEYVVDGSLGKNIVLSQNLYFTEFSENNVFSLHLGLSNLYDTEIGAENTYALRLKKSTFSFVKYTADGFTALKENIPYAYEGEFCAVTVSIDGDGETKIVVGDASETVEDVKFSRPKKSYFAYELTGDGTVKIDETAVKNTSYSRPYNKDLFADVKDDDI
ncbi:MAG: hypothetical protein IJB97_09410, partial [Clostridia bacterium]|nr:hypothetical protein [Clostridia bacterium]